MKTSKIQIFMNSVRLAKDQGRYRQMQSSNGETEWIIHANRKSNAASPKIWPSGYSITADSSQSLQIRRNSTESGGALLHLSVYSSPLSIRL